MSPNAKAFGYGKQGSLKTDKSYRPFHLIPCVIYEHHNTRAGSSRYSSRSFQLHGLTRNTMQKDARRALVHKLHRVLKFSRAI